MNVIKIFMMCVLVFNAFIPFSYAAKKGMSSSDRGLENDNSIKKNKCPDFTFDKIIDELLTGSADINHDVLGHEKSSWALTREGDHDQWRDVLKKDAIIKRVTEYPYLMFDDLYINKEDVLNAPVDSGLDSEVVSEPEKKIYISGADTKMFCDYKITLDEKELEFTVFQELEDPDFDKLDEETLQQVMEATKFQREEEYERDVKLLAEQIAYNQATKIQKNNTGLFKGIVLGGLLGLGLTYFVVKNDSTI
ncbi:MAG: hypothetical protein Q8S31_06175 [Alphaproteobacteria bacterium]|nr:hypothetical protein [Alphaproteobacteria bacterium]